MEHDIFISYARADKQIVDVFVTKLTEAGFKVWIDREGIYSGDQFAAILEEAIDQSPIMIFFSSIDSNTSKWTALEISYAHSKNKKIIPIRIDNHPYGKSIGFFLSGYDFIQYQPDQPQAAIERLLRSVTRFLDPNQPEIAGKSSEELFSLGVSNFISGNYEQATAYYESASELGNAWAQFELGICYSNGLGVPQDPFEAFKWYKKSAERGNISAQCQLAHCYQSGIGVTQNNNEAFNWFRIAASHGEAWSQFNLGSYYENGQNLNEAVSWYRKSAEQGFAEAQKRLALLYSEGKGVLHDVHEAFNWTLKAAEQGDMWAQNRVATCYEQGKGVPQNLEEAIKWYRIGSKRGNAMAIENLKRLGEWTE